LSRLPQATSDEPPTVALVGRVVPIKDIKTHPQAVHLLRRQFRNLRALILGPTDEQPGYVDECRTSRQWRQIPVLPDFGREQSSR
jgi:glycosyltransferase involved in cell wall biosynthesis